MFRRGLLAMAVCAALCATPGALAVGADDYRIEVDVTNQITTVYRTEDDAVVRQMICSTGLNDATPRGCFRLEANRPRDRREWYYISFYKCYVRYPTRIQDSILFHSLPYTQADDGAVDDQAEAMLGEKASHGCIRLRCEDARWIAENCPEGTETRIFTGTARSDALRKKLLEGSYSAESGMSYEAFAGDASDATAALRLGDSGAVVAALQRRLRALGWYACEVTGEYDDNTLIAVARCQRALGLSPTGFATEALLRRIASEH